MAIVTGTRTAYDSVLREVYTPHLWELQNRDRVMLALFQRDMDNYAEGKQIHVRLHVAGSGAVGYSAAGTLPAAGVQVFADATTTYARMYGRMRIDGALIHSTRSPNAAEVRALEFEAKHMVEDVADATEFDIWQDGTGKLGGTLTTPSGGASTTSFRVPKANCGIKKNQIIDVSSGATVTEGGTGFVVSSIVNDSNDPTKYLITIDGPLGGTGNVEAATYLAYRQGSRGGAFDGIQNIVASDPTTGTYMGINRGTAGNEFWRNQFLNNPDTAGTNRGINLPLIQQMRDEIEMKSPGKTSLIVCDHAIWRKVAGILVPDKRYGGDIQKLNAWCSAVMFDGIPIVRDKYCPPNKMYFFDQSTWAIYQDSEGGFLDDDGQILHQVAGADAYEAAWRRFLQLVCHDPAANGVLNDIDES